MFHLVFFLFFFGSYIYTYIYEIKITKISRVKSLNFVSDEDNLWSICGDQDVSMILIGILIST
jgi:hypothetical protein